MAKIITSDSEQKRLNVVIPKELGELPRSSINTSKFEFGFLDQKGVRVLDFMLREMNGEDEEIIESQDSIAEKMMTIAKRLPIKIGDITDRKVIEEIVLNQLCFLDLLKIIYVARFTTLGNVFKYKAICVNILKDEQGKMSGVCGHISTQMGDLSSVKFARTQDGDIVDEYEVEIGADKYILGRLNGYRQLQMSRDYGVKASGLKTALVAGRLLSVNNKAVNGMDDVKKLNLKTINKLNEFIDANIDEGLCDDVFYHTCSSCKQRVESEIELDSDFFSLAE